MIIEVGIAVANNLREFGYNVTDEFVQEVCRKLIEDNEMSGGVIGEFARVMLVKNGYMKEGS